MIKLKCKKHPKYKAIRKPKSCDICAILWAAKNIIIKLENGNHVG
jgi:hypothetical protein